MQVQILNSGIFSSSIINETLIGVLLRYNHPAYNLTSHNTGSLNLLFNATIEDEDDDIVDDDEDDDFEMEEEENLVNDDDLDDEDFEEDEDEYQGDDFEDTY